MFPRPGGKASQRWRTDELCTRGIMYGERRPWQHVSALSQHNNDMIIAAEDGLYDFDFETTSARHASQQRLQLSKLDTAGYLDVCTQEIIMGGAQTIFACESLCTCALPYRELRPRLTGIRLKLLLHGNLRSSTLRNRISALTPPTNRLVSYACMHVVTEWSPANILGRAFSHDISAATRTNYTCRTCILREIATI